MLYDDHENYHQYQLVCHWLQCTGKLPSCLVGLVGQVASSVQMEISNNFIFISFKIADLYDSYRLIWLPQKSFVGEWYPHSSLHIFDRNFQASACVHNFREGCGYPRVIISIKMCIESLPYSSTCFHHPTPSWNQSPTLE